jgi:membrane associated rhomboid family serine protease
MIPIKDSARSYSTPWVTISLIVANVAAFLFQLSLDPFTRNDFIHIFGFVPESNSWFSLFTSMFLHGGWAHLLGNMLFLWVFGDNIEDILGHFKFIAFYLVCGVAAAYGQYLLDPDSRIPMVGASGAISGIMGAYMVKFPHSRIVMLFFALFVFTFEVPAWLMLVYWFFIQLVSGAGSIAEAGSRGGTAFFAHVGGFVAGAALIFLLKTRDRYRGRPELTW